MKMQSKIIILIAGVLLAAVGCNKQEEFDSETAGKGSVSLEIAEVNPAGLLTRAVVDGETFPQDGHIGLFLFKDENALTGFGSDYKNVKYSYNSQKGKWTASTPIKVGSTPGYLFGYYPYVDDKSTPRPPINIKGIEISSSFNGDDVMYVAKQDPVTDQTAGNVSVTMKHALARVAITVVNKGYTGDAKLQSIKFTGAEVAASGELNAVNGTITATKAEAVTLTVPSEKQQISAEGTVFECLLVPSAVVASKQSVNLSLTIDGQTKTVNLDGGTGIILASDVKSSIELNLDDSGLSVASVIADNSQVVEVKGHKVTAAVESDVQGNILVNAYEEAGTVKIRAISISGRPLICTRDDSGIVSSTTSGDFWEFTIANITKDVTATVDCLRSISAESNPALAGTVTGTGLYAKGTDITIKATANGDFAEFIGWVDTAAPADMIEENPYTFKVSKDASYVAVFKQIGDWMTIHAVSEGIGSGPEAVNVVWKTGDKIWVRNSSSAVEFTLIGGEETAEGIFSSYKSISGNVEGFYPSSIVTDGGLVWPAEQQSKQIYPMYSKKTITSTQDQTLNFNSLGAVLQLNFSSITEDIILKSIEVKAKEAMSGAFAVDADGKAIISQPEGNKPGITLDLGDEGVKLGTSAKKFNIPVPAGTYHGLSIVFTSTNGKECTIKYDEVNIVFNTVKTLSISSEFHPVGALPGVFSVSPNKQVHFSKGNLTYNVSTKTWAFYEHQYDCAKDISTTLISLFTFGYGDWSTNPTGTGCYQGGTPFPDWGSRIGDDKIWRTLDSGEWNYLFNSRAASTVNETPNARYAKATVNGKAGVILLPDTYTHPGGVLNSINKKDAAFTANIYNLDAWEKMESAGAVFLPAAGSRDGDKLWNLGEECCYWSSTPDASSEYAYFAHITKTMVKVYDWYDYRKSGRSVRLVLESQWYSEEE